MKSIHRSYKLMILSGLLSSTGVACVDGAFQEPGEPMDDVGQPWAQTTGGEAPAADLAGEDVGISAATDWPTVTSNIPRDPAIESAVASLVGQMSLAQKVGQMVQPEIQAITPAEVKTYHIGSVLNGGGSWPQGNKQAAAAAWVALADAFYDASMDTSGPPGAHLPIPIIWGTDAVHGHSNVLRATLFPHNIGLGAANDPDLIEQIARITAKEVAVTGLDWTFAPTLAVVRDERWGRSYEGFSEDPEIVRTYAGRIVTGLQGAAGASELFNGEHVIATAKHFLGDGGTNRGIDQGDTQVTEAELRDIHAQGYINAIQAGAQTVMASYSSWQGQKMHGSQYLLTDILKGRFGFDGFIIGDWNGHAQLPGCNATSCPAAINAGIDMIMVPHDWRAFITNTIAQVQSGQIPMSRINDAVTRILRVKMRLGLLGPRANKGRPSQRPLAGQSALLGAPAHRAVARSAVRKSLVLLKNKNRILPLAKNINVLVAGKSANSISNQTGGWTLTWQGTGNSNADFPNAQSIYAGIAQAVSSNGGSATLSVDGSAASSSFAAAIVVIGETPYAEGAGDIAYPQPVEHAVRHPEDLMVIERIRAQAPNLPIITVFLSGRPLRVNKELNRSNAFVAGWLPGSEGGGVADVLFGDYDFSGRLSFSWPSTGCQTPINRGGAGTPLFPYGYGLTYQMIDTLGDNLPETSVSDCSAPQNPGNGRLPAVTAVASSVENAGLPALAAIDGNRGTRWSSAFSDPQWIYVDLGSSKAINRIVLDWETAASAYYEIQVSNNATSWTKIYENASGNGGIDDFTVSGSGRYVRMYSHRRTTVWGNSLWELEVYGGDGTTCSTETRLTVSGSSASSGTAGLAFDGNVGTRWESSFQDPGWLRADLGVNRNISRVHIDWETARAKDFDIQVSSDGNNWTTVSQQRNTAGGNHSISNITDLTAIGRYVRMYGLTRTTQWGYSIWEMQVHGCDGSAASAHGDGGDVCAGNADCGQYD
jgi:beta-glucosidase